MILPIHTSIRPSRTPYANYILIGLNIVCFILTYIKPEYANNGQQLSGPLRVWAHMFMLISEKPSIWQFVTYAFLHGGMMHIAGNMYFLYLFGNNVNDRLGNVGYICLYLAGGVFAGLGHAIFNTSNVLGASGAVAAITGAYMVFFPKTLITIVYWFIIIGTFEIPAFYFIGLKLIVIDNLISSTAPDIAYGAHIAGYAFGIAASMMLLGMKFLESDHSDMWSMARQWNRRRRYRDTVANGYDPFSGNSVKKTVKAKPVKKNSEEKQRDEQIMQFRNEISAFINQRNLPDAASKYIELVNIDEKHVLPRQYQLDVANQLMADSKWVESADAYEKFLAHYRTCEYTEQVQLMLGVIYSRYLDNRERAIECFTAAKAKLTDASQIKMCTDALEKLNSTDPE